MIRRLRLALLALLLLASMSRGDEPLTATKLAGLTFEQKLDSKISGDLPFFDETGKRVQLLDCFTSGPTILALGYYECPMLCNLTLNGLVQSLQEIKSPDHREVTLIFVSIDPSEAPQLAADKKQTYLKRFGRSNAASAWHFLTGKPESIHRLAQEVGFPYAYDRVNKQFAHPSGILILTPEGKVSRYFFGVNYPAKDLDSALRTAGSGRVAPPVAPFLMLCSKFMTLTGRYSGQIMFAVRALAIVSVLALGSFVVISTKRKKGVTA
jgi:protein SCO1/2